MVFVYKLITSSIIFQKEYNFFINQYFLNNYNTQGCQKVGLYQNYAFEICVFFFNILVKKLVNFCVTAQRGYLRGDTK